MSRNRCALGIALPLILAVLPLGACGGGGGGGDDDGGGGGQASLLSITAAGLANPLWQNVNGTPVQPPQCSSPVSLNSTITFTFAGAVNASTLPSTGIAQGSINITTTGGPTTVAAQGRFLVVDDPALPPGNQRRVIFRPTPPSDPLNPNISGLASAVQYSVFVPKSGNGPQVLTVAGVPLGTEALTCFFTCNTASPPPGESCFTDYELGPAYIVSTTPASNDPAPGAINPVTAGNRVSLFFNEPLFPTNININNVKLQTQSGAQVPGAVQFFQAGSPEAGPTGARIDYIASSQLLPSTTYEVVLTSNITDFGGNPVVLYNPTTSPPPSGRRFFVTTPVTFCPTTPIVEEFDTIANRASTVGEAQWTGTGQVVTTFPASIVGNGSFGPIVFAANGTLDPGMTAVTGFANGVWDATQVTINAGVTVRCTGHATGNRWRIHLRSLGNVDITGTLNANAGVSALAPVGDPEQGARSGAFNNGVQATPAAPAWVAGGVGGSGGGRGGNASQADVSGPQTRTPIAEAGLGPPVNGAFNTGPYGANPLFGGGQGGYGGFTNPSGGLPGEPGGLGGAGGSSYTQGLNGGPNAPLPTCSPIATVASQQRAQATPSPAAMVPPISVQSAGSGGGGGGDRFELSGVTNDDQGGGGGGGGGGIRLSAIGSVNLNAGCMITLNGALGGNGSVFNAGYGGGGSGGELWVQSFGQIVVAPTATMTVNGGTVGQPCGNFGAGRGGVGLYQFEDSDGIVNMMFNGIPTGLPPGSNAVNVVTFPYSTTVIGRATSNFFDTGYGAPDFTSATSMFTLGNAPGATVNITFQGAFENVTGGGPNLATISAPVPATNLDALDGYRFIRFVIDISYAAPPTSAVTNTFPVIDNVTINYSIPCAVP